MFFSPPTRTTPHQPLYSWGSSYSDSMFQPHSHAPDPIHRRLGSTVRPSTSSISMAHKDQPSSSDHFFRFMVEKELTTPRLIKLLLEIINPVHMCSRGTERGSHCHQGQETTPGNIQSVFQVSLCWKYHQGHAWNFTWKWSVEFTCFLSIVVLQKERPIVTRIMKLHLEMINSVHLCFCRGSHHH